MTTHLFYSSLIFFSIFGIAYRRYAIPPILENPGVYNQTVDISNYMLPLVGMAKVDKLIGGGGPQNQGKVNDIIIERSLKALLKMMRRGRGEC